MADDARDRFNYKDENGEWQTLDPGPTRIKEHIIDDEKVNEIYTSPFHSASNGLLGPSHFPSSVGAPSSVAAPW